MKKALILVMSFLTLHMLIMPTSYVQAQKICCEHEGVHTFINKWNVRHVSVWIFASFLYDGQSVSAINPKTSFIPYFWDGESVYFDSKVIVLYGPNRSWVQVDGMITVCCRRYHTKKACYARSIERLGVSLNVSASGVVRQSHYVVDEG